MAITEFNLNVVATPQFSVFGSTFIPAINDQLITYYGSSSGQSDRLFYTGGNVTASSPVTFDLRGGSLLQPDQTAFSIVKLKRLIVVTTSTTGRLIIGGGSNPLAGVTGFASKGCPFICGDIDVGLPVTAGSADILQIDCSSGTMAYKLIVEGTST